MRIEISTMKGEIPRLESHLLPNEAASLAFDCTYERGVVAPMRSDQEHGTLATLSPVTLFYYAHSHWFTFTQRVMYRTKIIMDRRQDNKLMSRDYIGNLGVKGDWF
ncbi:hypothetical protein VCSRO16_2878 [Vibrio cholerae]|nr:hypothetical protein VCSRO16_2878 [Vibrio cholerae]